jgi:long-chain acyl-CoA synthetase
MAARRFGDKIALHSNEGGFSFNELQRRISSCAAGLGRFGLNRGDRVVLHLANSCEWIVAYYAIARLGCVIVPANILLVCEEVQFIVDDSQAAAVIAHADKIVPLREASQSRGCVYVAVGNTAVPGAVNFNDLLQGESPDTLVVPDSCDVSTIGYTSGTTGRSKGAVLTHRAVMLNTAMTATMHVRTSADTVVTALPCSHVYGNVVMNAAFLCGYSLVLLQRFDAE